jgi:hypothetical protein
MSKPDTSREAVELRAQQHDGTSAIVPGLLRAWYRETADLLRALVDERDELQAKLRGAALDRLAANDAPLLDAEAAFAAGAEAMRRAAQDACQAAFQPAPAMDATAVNAVRAGVALCVATIRALPLPTPKMETSND